MNHFENALCDLIDLEEKLSSDWVDVANGDAPQQTMTDNIHDLRDIIAEFRKHHETLVYQDHLIKKLAGVRL